MERTQQDESVDHTAAKRELSRLAIVGHGPGKLGDSENSCTICNRTSMHSSAGNLNLTASSIAHNCA